MFEIDVSSVEIMENADTIIIHKTEVSKTCFIHFIQNRMVDHLFKAGQSD